MGLDDSLAWRHPFGRRPTQDPAVAPTWHQPPPMLAAAADDLEHQQRPMFGLAPRAKAARVLEEDPRLPADTIAKLLYEWHRPDRPPTPSYRLPPGADSAIHLRRIDNTVNPPQRAVTAAQQRLDALDTWHTWATGSAIDGQQLSQIMTLGQPRQTDIDPRQAALVSVVREWADGHNIELLADTRRLRQLDIGLKL